MFVHVRGRRRHVLQGTGRVGQSTHDLLKERGHTDATAAGSIKAILYGNVIIRHDARYLDAVGLGQLSRHLEVQYVTRVVLDNMQHTCATIDSSRCGEHLVGHGRGKDFSGTCRVEHTTTDKATVHRLVTTTPTRDHTYFATYPGIPAHHNLVLEIHTDPVPVHR